MSRPTPRLITAVTVGLVGLLGASITRRPELVAMAAPFVVIAAVGLVAVRPPALDAHAVLDPTRVLEGERLVVEVTLTGGGPGLALVAVDPPPGLDLAVDQPGGRQLQVGSSRPRDGALVEFELVANRWGAIEPVKVEVVVTDRWGLAEHRQLLLTGPARVLPSETTLRQVVSPRTLRSIAGSHRSNRRGDGVEFSDSRPFVAGDRARDVNWRVTARRDELWVDQRHPERSGEVVVFLDSFAVAGDSIDNTLRRAVELAQSLTEAHIALNDRVGLVDLGGVLRWVRPSGGTMQLYRIVETLIETELWASGADKTVDVLPARALPRRSLVVALSPLLDPRGIRALATLRARGFDVAVVEVVAGPFVEKPTSRTGRLARRMWEIEQEAVRRDLRSRGIAVGQWLDGEPLDDVLRSIGLFRNAVLRAAR